MATCSFVFVCEKSVQDKATNCWSYINVVENIQASVLPGIVPFDVFTHWRFEPDEVGKEFEFALSVIGPDGKATDSGIGTAVAQEPAVYIRNTGLQFPEQPGAYGVAAKLRMKGSSEWTQSPSPWVLNVSLEPDSQS